MMELLYPVGPAPLYPRPSIEHPGRPSVLRGEVFPLVEPSGLVYGQAPREWCHGGSRALHPVVHLHIVDREGKVYLQRRSFFKKNLPGYWDSAVGGHVGYGEQPLEALYREAAEEIGLQGFTPVPLNRYVWECERERELVFVYGTVGHPVLTPDHVEVMDGKWWSVEELDAAMGQGSLTPDFEEEFPRIRTALLALL